MQFTNEQILAISTGSFFGQGNAQLPNSYMLMIDQIDYIEATGGSFNKGQVDATLEIRPDQWFFACHFQNDPVMPGCLGLDALWQLLGVFLAWSGLPGRGRALGVGKVKFSGQIYPDAKRIKYHLDIKRVFSKPMPLGTADGVVLLDNEEIYRASDLKVGLIPS